MSVMRWWISPRWRNGKRLNCAEPTKRPMKGHYRQRVRTDEFLVNITASDHGAVADGRGDGRDISPGHCAAGPARRDLYRVYACA
ncbi:MAG: hypothetical protein LZF86_10063 [Nitrospira sp.]|nr:MAG: hypothetical protein LZF86_10063 [Nitrospira sp.]